ncbi:4Fe-4S dicluster domain-containing protein, partial [Candidatus Thorarchaeota archaeon]
LTELQRGVIMFVLSKMGSKTVLQMADLMEMSAADIQTAIVSMIQRGEVEMVGLDGDAPVFAEVHESVPDTTLILKRVIQQIRGVAKALQGSSKKEITKSLEHLEQLLGRLQKLGHYDETALAEHMTKLRDTADAATEAALSTSSDEASEDLRLLISAGLEAFARFRLKITLEKGPNLVSGTNVYGEKLDPEVYEKMMSSYLDNELERGTMLILIRELGAMTAEDLAKRTPIPQDRILQHLLRMKRDELLTLAGEKHGYVLFDVPRTPSEAEVAIQSASDLALQLSLAKAELDTVLGDFKAEYIGRLANSLEAIAKARDRLEKITVDGGRVGASTLKAVEESSRSAVAMAYRTRARLPSTRPKVTLEELQNVDVPSVLDEYRSQMGYAPLLGFGTINWEMSRCLGCKSCEIACPEDAIELKPVIEVPKFFDFSEEEMEKLPVNKSLFYTTVRNLAVEKPAANITLDKEAPGFGTVEVDLWLCVACRTCVRRCPGPEDGALELELKWNLPEVVRQITA